MTPLQKGILHRYDDKLTAFEFGDRLDTDKAIIFIGGLGDQYLTVPYVPQLQQGGTPQWRVFQIMISSSGEGWGTGSLDRDINEIGKLVKYLRNTQGVSTVVLFGHSTGCQDCMHYVLNDGEGIEGIVLQASVSDREAMSIFSEGVDELNNEARAVYDSKGPLELLPRKFSEALLGVPLNAYRWLSLAEKDGDDDYFSSDLSDEALRATFGKINKPSLFLYSGSDEMVPESIDKKALLERWQSFTDPKYWNGTIIEGASHNVGSGSIDERKAVEDLVFAVKEFLNTF